MRGVPGGGGVDPEFAAYVSARQHTLLRAAYLVCGDAHLAEDLLQEALVKLAGRWQQVREGQPDAYVRRILYRDAVSSWRRRRREVLGVAAEPVPLPGAAGEVEERIDLWRALDALTPRQRAVLVLRFYEDRSVADTAEALGVSEGTVKSQTHAALARLRDVLPGAGLPAADGGVR